MKDVRVWAAAAGLAVAAWLWAPVLFPPREPALDEAAIPQIRYVCRKSGEVFTLPLAGGSVANPKTGEPTLVPAVFDQQRKRWVPGPPVEVMHRQGLVKPKT